MKARLDIKVAIYKEPARVSARAARISSIIRISMHTRAYGAHTYVHVHVDVRGGGARKRTRGGTGRPYLHIESVS